MTTTLKAIFWLFFISSCSAQINSSVFCGMELRLGMAKSEVLAKLEERCKLQPMSSVQWCAVNCSHWVTFDNDKLTSVHKSIGDATGAEAAEVLAGFISSVDRVIGGDVSSPNKPEFASGPVSVHTYTTVIRDPEKKRDVVMKILTLRFAHKIVSLEINRPVGDGPMSFSPIAVSEDLIK
jgi:hypothetical protein